MSFESKWRKPAVVMAGAMALSLVTVGTAGSAFADTPTWAAPIAGPAVADDCGWQPYNDADAGGFFNTDGVNIRTGPGTDCPSEGQGNRSDLLTLLCGADSQTGAQWIYLYDDSTGVIGWSFTTFVTINNGSVGPC